MRIAVRDNDGSTSSMDIETILGVPQVQTTSIEDRLTSLENQLLLSENNNITGGIF